MRVLVTGGAGYIGSFTTRALREAGHDVVVFDNLSYGHRQAVDAPLVVGDLNDANAVATCLRDGRFDAIIHFAAFIEAGESMKDAAPFFTNNTSNALRLFSAAAEYEISQVVFSSTAGVYGDVDTVPIPETARAAPVNTYAETKYLVEQALPWYDRVNGMRSVSLRYFNAAGAALDGSHGQDHEPATHVIPLALKAALGQRDSFTIFGDDYPTSDGTCIRDYIHVLDLASAHVAALAHLSGGGESTVYNVGTGHGYSVRDVVETAKRVSGVDFPVEIGPRRPGDPAELVADSSRLQRELGWRPRYSDLDTIMESTWRWQSAHPHGYAAEGA